MKTITIERVSSLEDPTFNKKQNHKIMEITDDWRKLKGDAMASFIAAGLAANPSLTYLTPVQFATKAIELADALQKSLDLEATPQNE